MSNVRRAAAQTTFLMAIALCATTARGDGVANVMTAKSIPPATVAIIDPEGGSSSGGGTTDVRVGVGDIILFRMNVFPVPNGQIHGLNGWINEYVPPNTEVVGLRFIDDQGYTIEPNVPGIATNGCGRTCNRFDSVPSMGGTTNLDDGAIAQLYADTGIFYATDSRLARNPGTSFITLDLPGIDMTGQVPTRLNDVDGAIGATAPYVTHNTWDWIQVRGYGISNSNGNASENNGTGNTPFRYGSPVAGPLTHFDYEVTEVSPAVLEFNDVTGPWQRIQNPGSLIGTGGAVSSRGGPLVRMTADASTMGFDLSPANPLPNTTRSVRFATGETRVGEPVKVEIALRVLGTPIDNVQMADVNCAEAFGGDTSARSSTGRAEDNSWSIYLGAPACVFLNLLFDLTSDSPLATGGQEVVFTLRTRNLSTLDQENAVITQKFDSTRVAYVGPEPGTPAPMMISNCDGDGLECLVWTARDYIPSEETNYETRFTIGGGGQVTHRMRAAFVSDSLPGGFSTQELNMIRSLGVVEHELASITPLAPAGGTASLSGMVGVGGTGNIAFDEYIVVLPAGWTLTSSDGDATPDIRLNGAVLECSDNCATNTPEFNLAVTLDPGVSRTIDFDVNVPAGTATGLYDIDVSQWASQSGFGGAYETYFNNLATVAVGQQRSEIPTLDCPILSNQTTILGDTTEADGTTVRLYFSLIERGSGTSSGNRFDVGTFGPATAFGELYGGLEVRATAQAPGELESELSVPCFVSQVPICSDGIDNDGDGLTDFPADPGCSSAADGNEADVECSDGIDNDGDGDIDFPEDLECSSPNDTDEGGQPACNDGIDNDGDGDADFPADSDCTSATDRSEKGFAACNDGLDNDGDGFADFPDDPGCHSMLDEVEVDPADTPGEIRARMLFVFDSSGSMNWNTCADEVTGGDGSAECAGSDVSCATCGTTGCGNGIADDSRLHKAKNGLSQVVTGFGELEYGLMRFHQRPTDFVCVSDNVSQGSGGWQGAGADPCGGGFDSADLLVGFSQENQPDLLAWMDGDSGSPTGMPQAGCDLEIRGTGTTPLGGSLASAESYLDGVAASDSVAACRPYVVVLITDGAETCGGDPVGAANSLRLAGYTTYVVGFAVSDAGARASLDAIAAAGGGRPTAIYVTDEAQLAAEISDIIDDTVLVEVCNSADDDCDTLVDEGVSNACGNCGPVPTETCNTADDDCDGVTDEGVANACGTCGAPPVETCNLFDDDCDGAVDEGACGGCVPSAELCNNLDDDCDLLIDEGLMRGCGNDVGECTTGTETCMAGGWGGCTGITPTAETCNGLDDDCDGVIDGQTRPCGTDVGVCRRGVEICTGGVFDTSMCIGGTGPGTEVCNTLDDDCDGIIDEGTDPGTMCGSSIGICTPGTLRCELGSLVCRGGTSGGPETCNAVDDDCDGATDESVPTGGPCGDDTGACSPGVLICNLGTFDCIGAVGPGTEICDGVDNDCDGPIDEGSPGAGMTCGTTEGVCEPGTTECVGGALACTGGVEPDTETCNVLDDDCDGLVDEGNPDGGASCGTTDVGECEFGTEVCVDGGISCVGAEGPETEICDGLDNDCDGMTDEGNPEGGDACGDDTGACMAGTTLCTGGELVCDGAVGPTVEICNAIDDDCDGVIDDGLDVGAPCGSDVGECVPGVNICRDGAIVCEGELGPLPEECDALDNDCDTAIDEELPLGGACGEMEGVCLPGMLQCVDGRDVCVGSVPAGPETCDCEDNDCDGLIDEDPDTGAICPGESQCVDCQCALPCIDSEFGRCPTGRVEVDIDGMCFCTAPRCNPDTCPDETVEREGTVRCAPDTEGVPSCECLANECTFPCDGVVCDDPTVCNPFDGTCVVDDCTGLGCMSGEICEIATGDCIPHPCAGVMCDGAEACRDGACEPSCSTVMCADGEICSAGVCAEDLCADVSCDSSTFCDPATGMCETDPCVGLMCPPGTVCDPVSGGCGEDPCARLVCPDGDRCVDGECELIPVMPDAGPMDEDAGTPDVDAGGTEEDPEDRVVARGGGGCNCRTTGDGSPLALVFVALVAWARRRRGVR